MRKFNTFNIVTLSFSLLALPLVADVQSELVSNHDFNLGHSVERCACDEERGHSRGRKIKPLKLSDFEGEWILGADSVGGVAGAEARGDSYTFDGQVSIYRDGFGKMNFFEGAVYNGIETRFIDLSNLDLQLTISDPYLGTGTLEFTDPAAHLSFSANFVAVRSPKGKALRLEGHSTSEAPIINRSVTSYTLERQYQ